MKKIIFILILMMATLSVTEAQGYAGARVAISIQTFYDELSPYGEWINMPEYGYVWRPYANDNEDFRPYSTNGRWLDSDLGWTWASDYPWGWATFHYGRWYYDDSMGWLWIPGYEWAPAWVTWGSYNNYWGWAPLGPGIYVGLDMGWHAPGFWWNFVPYNRFCDNDWYRYRYGGQVYFNQITRINNIYHGDRWGSNTYGSSGRNDRSWYYGPRVNDVERLGNLTVRRYQIGASDRPGRMSIGNDRRLNIYRPEIVRDNRNAHPSNQTVYQNSRSGSPRNMQNQRSVTPDMNRRSDNINNPGYNNPGNRYNNNNRSGNQNPVYQGGNDTRRVSPGNSPGQGAGSNTIRESRGNNYQKPDGNRQGSASNSPAPSYRSFPQRQSPVYNGDRVGNRNNGENRSVPQIQRFQQQPSRVQNIPPQRSEPRVNPSNNGGNNRQREAQPPREERSSDRRR